MSYSSTLPAYIEDRIRQPIPANVPIVPNSTPVIAFGDVRTATVATLGLNPSRVEFLDRKGNELTGPERRLETLTSLNVSSLVDAPLDKVKRVFERCNSYFQHNPYDSWFGKFNPILDALDVSYRNGTACHLDLVQWATNPVWSKIECSLVREQLIQADADFLHQQLFSEQIKVLLLNGKSVIEAIENSLNIKLFKYPKKLKRGSLYFFNGYKGFLIIGWTTNLQSSYGVSSLFREQLANEVASIVIWQYLNK